MRDELLYLLLQVRNPDDPMRAHEVRCFARALRCGTHQIRIFDLLSGVPRTRDLAAVDVVLLGGSGDYSVAEGGAWLHDALDAMRELHERSKPTFASCWGFQAMSLAMGGRVVTDLRRAEIGTRSLRLTAAGCGDPVLGALGATFDAQMGHQDVVDRLPEGAVLLASSDLVENQAFRFDGKPIYCTQFHPELRREDLLLRLRTYPKYVEALAGVTFEQFEASLGDTPRTETVLSRFVREVMGEGRD